MTRTLMLAAGGYLLYRMLQPRDTFRGKHAIVTGGSRGLGLVLARQLVDAGARVTICARDEEELGRARDELRRRGGQAFAIPSDVTQPEQVRALVHRARYENGPIDVLVSNAGIIQVGPYEEMRQNDYVESLDTHFWAFWYLCREVVPEMVRRRSGHIVSIASFGGKVAVPHLLPYCTGKFALVGFSNGLGLELRKHGVFVTTVCPGLMRTGSHLQAQFKGRHEEEYNWFAMGNGLPGLSMSAESAARRILDATARGDAEAILGLPARLGVAAQALAPNLLATITGLVDRWVMPEPGGIGPRSATGAQSRGQLSPIFTKLTDRAAVSNNETLASPA